MERKENTKEERKSMGKGREKEQRRAIFMHVEKVKKIGKAIPVTGRGSPLGCETSRLPHFLDNRLTDGGEVRFTRRPPFTPRKMKVSYLFMTDFAVPSVAPTTWCWCSHTA
jgi:hypothetical protein